MTAFLGRSAVLSVDDAVPGVTYVDVNKVQDITLSMSGDAIETTNNDDAGFTSYVTGFADAELTFAFVADDVYTNTTGQGFIKKQYDARADIAFRLFPKGTGTGLPSIIGSGVVTKLDNAAPTKDVQKFNVTIKISGALTHGTQS